MAHLIENRPDLDRGKLQRTRALMDAAIDDCLVTGYGSLVEGLTLPDLAVDRDASWQEAEILHWFDERGPEFFEPLEIWHVDVLGETFRRRVGRSPKSDRSYLPPWPVRAQRFGRRLVNAARRRLPV